MGTSERNLDRECWLDLFEASHFGGKMRRYFGPTEVKRLSAASLIVGPKARVQLKGTRRGRPVMIELQPKLLVADLEKSTRGTEINLIVVRVEAAAATTSRVGKSAVN